MGEKFEREDSTEVVEFWVVTYCRLVGEYRRFESEDSTEVVEL